MTNRRSTSTWSAALPMVAEFSRVHGVGTWPSGEITLDNLFTAPFTLATDGHVLVDFDRPVLSEGPVPDPESLDEVYVDRTYATTAGLHVGDTVSVPVFPPELLGAAFALFEAGEFDAGGGNAEHARRRQDSSTFASPGSATGSRASSSTRGTNPRVCGSGPRCTRSWVNRAAGYGGATVRLTDPSRLEEFKAAVDAMAPDEKIVYQTLPVSRAKAMRATEPAATALRHLRGDHGAARHAARRPGGLSPFPTRRARQSARWRRWGRRTATGSSRRCCGSGVAVAVGLVMAVAARRSAVVADARSALPSTPSRRPGFEFAAPIVLGGALVLLVVFVAVGTIPAWNNARYRRARRRAPRIGNRRLAGGPRCVTALTTGVRFALEPGRGSTAVPPGQRSSERSLRSRWRPQRSCSLPASTGW